MIEKGDYSFEVMNNETGQALLEHNKDGISYVEVEPDVQYFIRFKNESTNDVIIHGFIDEGDLGYMDFVPSKLSTDIGTWSVQGSVSETKLLKFAKFSKMPEVYGRQTNTNFFGNFKFDIYSVLHISEHHSKKRHKTEIKSNWESKLEDIPSKHGGDKRLYSKFGNKTLSTCGYRQTNFYKGEHIEIVEIKYGTAFGLAFKGVLPISLQKKFNWKNFARLNRGPKYKLLIEPKIGCIQTENGTTTITVTAELFDLSVLSDDEPTVEEVCTMEEKDPKLIKEENFENYPHQECSINQSNMVSSMDEEKPKLIKEETSKNDPRQELTIAPLRIEIDTYGPRVHESFVECLDFATDPDDKLTQYAIPSKYRNKHRKVRVKNFGLIEKCIPYKMEDGDHNN